MKINLGCGNLKIPGFVNIDHRADCNPDLVTDVFTLEALPDDSAEEIVASHVLEHACFDRTVEILKAWRRVLLPKTGKLWLAVPDFELVMTEHYKEWRAGRMTWERFESRIFGNPEVARQMYGPGEIMPGIKNYELAFHRAVFTREMLWELLESVGYAVVNYASSIPYKDRHPHEFCMVAMK